MHIGVLNILTSRDHRAQMVFKLGSLTSRFSLATSAPVPVRLVCACKSIHMQVVAVVFCRFDQ